MRRIVCGKLRKAILGLMWSFLPMGAGAGLRSESPAVPPRLEVAVLPGPQLRLEWQPVDGAAFWTVEVTPSLVPPRWEPLGGEADWPIASNAWIGDVPGLAPAFFRVVRSAPPERGGLLSVTHLDSWTRAEVKELLSQYGIGDGQVLPIDAWKLIYRTVDPRGSPTRASALVVTPAVTADGPTNPVALPMAIYHHGTITLREAVPSRLVGESEVGRILGGVGYVAVLPDYLGLGDSPGLHPYQHARSEATAAVDALRAARDFLVTRGIQWNRQLFVTGYSQGGHAALSTQRELETHHAGEFTITASAPCAGAYDMSGVAAADFLSNRLPPNPYYSAYLLISYVRVYELYASPGSVLREPYDTTIPPLFDGFHDSGVINAALPARPADAVRPEFLAAFRDEPDHPMRIALRDNDLHTGWKPVSPTRLYHCSGDEDVLPANSTVAFNAFKGAGAGSVELIDPLVGAGHGLCAPFALLQVKAWFDSLKR